MKKVIKFLVIIIMITLFIIPISLKAEISTYKVYVLNNLGIKTEPVILNTYEEALNKANLYENNMDNVSIIEKDNIVVYAKYAIVKLKTNPVFTYLYDNPELKGENYTYIDGDYGTDAAFISYNATYNSVKIKISGYSGWTNLNSVEIVPLSSISTNYITINKANTILKNTYGIDGLDIKTLQHNGAYIWTEKKEIDGYTWYHISEFNSNGWVKNIDNAVIEEKRPFLNTCYISFNFDKEQYPFNLIHFYNYRSQNMENSSFINLGLAPKMLTKYKYYYSFDGNYFYTDILKMLDDYKTDDYKNSINYLNPYFNYYMYLPNHTKTLYTKENFDQIIRDNKFISKPEPNITYVNDNGGWIAGIDRSGMSQMYGEGASFIESQELFGVNALLTFSVAINESGTGTSKIAFAKNNLFGHGATDDNPFKNAIKYNTVKDSIMNHAKMFSGGSYSNPNNWLYFGSHYGNKGSGMGVKYASDPYWGEKTAQNAYNRDLIYGGQDYNSNTIGIKLNDKDIPIKKNTSDSSETIYIIKNKNHFIKNVPFVVIDKVSNNGVNWYKVYTDTALNDKQNIADVPYVFNNSYGYIREDNLYVSNSQPVINASDILIEQGTSFDLMKNVSATDKEDGDLTNKIKINGQVDNLVVGVYPITYTVLDNSQFSFSKTINVTVFATSNRPVINVSNKEILQNTTFDPLLNVSANDPKDGDITSKLVVTNNVDVTKVGVYKVIYSVKNTLLITETKEITVTVLSNAVPIIRAENIYMKVGQNLTYKENLSIIDLEDGILTDKVIISSNVNKDVSGTYEITYLISDSNNNKVSKKINVFVEKNLISKNTEVYFNSLSYKNDLLEVTGSLAIIGIDNTKDTDIKYDLILKRNSDKYEIVLPLVRFLENHPNTIYSDNTHSYTETWFKGKVNLSNVIKGEYTLYVRARYGDYEGKSLFNNLFLKPVTKKATDSLGRGYLFRNNNFENEFPLELFISDVGLISKVEPLSSSNMFNSYSDISLINSSLKIVGNSFNMGGDYSKDSKVSRYLIFEDVINEKRFVYNIGSIVGEELILRTDDKLSKARSWFDTNNIDLKNLPVGQYSIYFRTISGIIDDYGELYDLFLKANNSVLFDHRRYTLSVNKEKRFRVELNISKE
ncbi:MAG: DUF5011 domain-containing protein [Bacilli bacterium]